MIIKSYFFIPEMDEDRRLKIKRFLKREVPEVVLHRFAYDYAFQVIQKRDLEQKETSGMIHHALGVLAQYLEGNATVGALEYIHTGLMETLLWDNDEGHVSLVASALRGGVPGSKQAFAHAYYYYKFVNWCVDIVTDKRTGVRMLEVTSTNDIPIHKAGEMMRDYWRKFIAARQSILTVLNLRGWRQMATAQQVPRWKDDTEEGLFGG
jgi:hypothetical protein